ncbi:hypothetical protein SARC_10253 [Sphaeroforma arctica JP610]|uniref:Uncharacterized protein n=1 Tax=Sphaeroforma arctica JP610 TaxID=667725 RepID=A0A0L0FMM9_9EUKA|nr:hypothetical protein SARC_10253 [Sphaeroforma arctica JP610]KNC77288.1 hypothetical protein SARC_10253 [Sphaeroforma arctica JP610]|eukprot:XP_014151190.1 hypothetical protein SARC_10253 [Sphaeroforma arctica JP610]
MGNPSDVPPDYRADGPNLMEICVLLMIKIRGEKLKSKADKKIRSTAILQGVLDGMFSQYEMRGTNVYLKTIDSPSSVVKDRKDELIARLSDCLSADRHPRLATAWVGRLEGGLVLKGDHQFPDIEKRVAEVLVHKGLLIDEKRTFSTTYKVLPAGNEAVKQIIELTRQVVTTQYQDEYAVAVMTVYKIVDPQLHSLHLGRSKEHEAYQRVDELFKTRPVHKCMAETYGIRTGWGILWFFNPKNLLPPMPW